MDTGEVEPWNNGYQLAAMAQGLLDRLAEQGALTEDAVRRYCLQGDELRELRDPDDREASDRSTIEAFAQCFCDPFASEEAQERFSELERRDDELRRTVAWNSVPADLQERCARRAETILAHVTERGWVECTADGAAWKLSWSGRGLLDRGGIYQR